MTCRELPDWSVLAKIPRALAKDVTAFHVFGSSGNELIFCTNSRQNNGGGSPSSKLGNSRVYRIQQDNENCQELLALRGKTVVEVVSSERSAVLVLTTDELFAFGNNQYGQIGNGESGQTIKDPIIIQGPLQDLSVAQVAIGCYHCACVTADGDLYTWGGWRAGDQIRKLGHTENCLTPAKVELASYHGARGKFVKVGCNSDTTFAVDDEGRVYCCGEAKFLSFGNERIVQISCAPGHCLALSSYGSVFAWGKNYRKQLGLQIDDDPIKEPKRIATFDNPYMRIVSVLAFSTMSLALSHSGIPYIWGETRLSGKVQFYFAQAERELDDKNKNSNNYYYWMLPRTCINSIPTPASAAAKWSLFTALQEEMIGPMVTPNLIRIVNDENQSSDAVSDLFDDASTSDFKIVADGQVINAHKVVLTNRSVHFRTMFSSSWREISENTLVVNDFSYRVYRAFVHYLYKGTITDDLTMEEAFSLIDIADMYFHDDLKTKLFDHALARWLTKEDAFELCGIALKKKADMVVSRCTSFILNNLTAVTKLAAFDKLLSYIDAKDILAIYQKANQAQLFKT